MKQYEIPAERLPPGFVEKIGDVDSPAVPKPAATVVLLRDATESPEVLLLKRHHTSGFVPGAYVFPGGRVDDADADARLIPRIAGIQDEPGREYWVAAAREAFEETGILLGRAPGDSDAAELERLRDDLLHDKATLLDILTVLDATLQFNEVAYFAHWITPVAEPRRYDTRFFVARVESQEASIREHEMSDAVWLNARDALARFEAGKLPMVFPTVRTLEQLAGFTNASDAIHAIRQHEVKPVLPRIVRTKTGAAIVVDDDS